MISIYGWKDNIKTDVKILWINSKFQGFIYLAQKRKQCWDFYEENNRPSGSKKALNLTDLETIGF